MFRSLLCTVSNSMGWGMSLIKLMYTAFNAATHQLDTTITLNPIKSAIKSKWSYVKGRQGDVETIQCYAKPHVIQRQLTELKQHATVLWVDFNLVNNLGVPFFLLNVFIIIILLVYILGIYCSVPNEYNWLRGGDRVD